MPDTPDRHSEIVRALRALERAEEVTILFAIESGSRAWGFASPDSDWDVRFVYQRPRDWYLSIVPGRDVIERPIVDGLDIAGWDLKKALGLLVKSNAVLLEWLVSPIRYVERPAAEAALHALAAKALQPEALVHHYGSLARQQWREFIRGREAVRLKKYLYVLRPTLALRWLRLNATQPPMALPELMAGTAPPAAVTDDVALLLGQKAVTHEMGEGPSRPALDAFLAAELAAAEGLLSGGRPDRTGLMAEADALFRSSLNQPPQ